MVFCYGNHALSDQRGRVGHHPHDGASRKTLGELFLRPARGNGNERARIARIPKLPQHVPDVLGLDGHHENRRKPRRFLYAVRLRNPQREHLLPAQVICHNVPDAKISAHHAPHQRARHIARSYKSDAVHITIPSLHGQSAQNESMLMDCWLCIS